MALNKSNRLNPLIYQVILVENHYVKESDILKTEISEQQKKAIEKAVDKVIEEYSETLRLLKET